MKQTDDITVLKGIGPRKAESLRARGINTLMDLLDWLPRSYEDRRRITPISRLRPGRNALICASVRSRRYSGRPYSRHTPVSFLVEDSTGAAEIVFFNGNYMSNVFHIGETYTFFGKVSENRGRLQMVHPQSCRAGDPADVRAVLPVYPQIPGISQKELRKYQRQLLPMVDSMEEWLPENIVKEYRLAGPAFAIRNIHFPKDRSHVLMSRYRMVFEELLALETGLLFMKKGMVRERGAVIDPSAGEEFINSLPFALTPGQERVWHEIAEDLRSPRAMNRLVQGDVGSGKTAIAEIAMFSAVRSGYQAVMMAPTEILARQHYQSLKKDFERMGCRIGLLCASLKNAEKKQVREQLRDGSIDILVGTHAVIQPDVVFHSLGIVITDEQHRFGVEQRHMLSSKGDNPNVCVMTATPIPRTLAVVLYGELDISVIDTMPASRRPIITKAADNRSRDRVYREVEKELDQGHQAYVVTPLIEDSEQVDARSAQDVYKELYQRFRDYRVVLIYGSLDQAKKEQTMEAFAEGSIDVLVSTVVIEVGINVPNATVMVIENAERFGLAQLHQLRGRVGRGAAQSYCYLVQGSASEISQKRMKILCESSDGFRIAEEDLNLRGPGEIFGTRQHGLPEMRISDIVRHSDILSKAREAAVQILEEDPSLSSRGTAELSRRVRRMFGDDIKLEL